VSQFLEKGYLKQALLNYIALIGWNPKTTQEIFSLDELVEAFSLEGLQIANGIFDPEKLKWMNGKYINALHPDNLYKELADFLKKYHPGFYENTFISKSQLKTTEIAMEVRSRMQALEDFITLSDVFYEEPEVDTNLLLSEKMGVLTLGDAKGALDFGLNLLKEMQPTIFHNGMEMSIREKIKEYILPKIAEAGKKNGQILWPLRVALTGKEFSPGAFEMTEIL
jgi:glutamyl/glutaminyl-tRNA synthetase